MVQLVSYAKYTPPIPESLRYCLPPKSKDSGLPISPPPLVLDFAIKLAHRICHALTTISYQLLIKIMACFHLAIEKNQTEQKIKKSTVPQVDLNDLFNIPVDYEKFSQQVFNFKKTRQPNIPFFNNYSIQSFHQLKECSPDRLDNCETQHEEDLEAGIACYEAIVKLYVERFLIHHPELNDTIHLPSLQMIALTVAVKLSYDQPVWNSDLKRFLPSTFPFSKMNSMELEFLKAVDWNTSTDDLKIDFKLQAKQEEVKNNFQALPSL